ncbi:hypothetical protein, conserved [Leishmania donovani]|uniref:Uncharacterized protein n=1 Tax=Leishmania donovani TaxID=5661 RepID=E9B891_LEIDO|nr:hypothetical protein, conserved [Leishmania donovani]TPP44015.1 hypothetical protein CGC21_9260 [Leishmania donovani]CBZ31464.1 hypothetical protein, conserved [Leishmania donovani]
MEKASLKHLEFQLQREKALTKDLDARCKLLSAQVAQLEQDKAELRREKLFLGEEAKKTSKLDDRVHILQKEVENRDAVIAAERALTQAARAEAEEIRRNANASIALWTAAEEQWTVEQTALNEAAAQCRSQIDDLKKEVQVQGDARAELAKQLHTEKERSNRLTQAREAMEVEVKSLHSQVEKLQNKVCDLEQTVFKLDLAGDKQREVINLKDTEIKTLEATIARHIEAEERLEQTISSLNDRINAAKMMNLEGKCENEKLQCDLVDAKKEVERLHLQAESLKRDSNFLSQSHSSVQKALEDLKEKHRQLQEDMRDKNVEIRRHELTISQLNMELKKSENQGGEWSFQYSTLETELQQTKEALRKSSASVETLLRENSELVERLKEQKQLTETKEEEMVVLQSQCDERAEAFSRDIRDLEKEITARQAVINELSDQLNSASEKNAVYHSKILEESEANGKMRQHRAEMLQRLESNEHHIFFLDCVVEKEKIFSSFLAYWMEAPMLLCANLVGHCQMLQGKTCVLLEHEEELSRESCLKTSQLKELQCQNEDQREQIAFLQRERNAQAERLSVLSRESLASEKEANELRGALEASRNENLSLTSAVAALHEQVVAKDAELVRKKAALTDSQSRVYAFSDAVSTLEGAILRYAMAQMEEVQDLWKNRLEAVGLHFTSLVSHLVAEKALLQCSKEQAEASCRELSAFAKEAKISMNKSDLAAAERQEALTSRAALLEGQIAVARREKDQAAMQLASLLRRFEADRNSFESFKREAKCTMEEERERREAVEKECVKLRGCIDAEVKRKCEYKQALENLKKLRSESEELRRAEKARAAEAIGKANIECNYWVKCFDHLKEMIEKSHRTGDRLPSIDTDTIHRLEVAKTKISPMQAREVNKALSSLPKLKRVREEASGAPT